MQHKSKMWPVYVLAILCSLIITATTYAEDKQILICSCKKPAFIIRGDVMVVYEMKLNDEHLNEMVVRACEGKIELPGVDTYDTGQAGNHACPHEI